MSKYKFIVKSAAAPVVQLSPDGIYVSFKQGAKAAKTIVQRRWPVVAVDLDEAGEVIGVECAPAPAQFTLAGIARDAGVRISDRTAARAEFQTVEKLHAVA